MSQEPLIRMEAIAAYNDRLGEPVRPVTLTTTMLVAFIALVFSVAAIFVVIAKYSRKETVYGLLEPDGGVLRIASQRSGTISKLAVKQGDEVKAGEIIAVVSTDPVIAGNRHLRSALATASEARSAALEEQIRAHRQSTQQQKAEIQEKLGNLDFEKRRLSQYLELQKRRVELSAASLDAAKPLGEKGYVSLMQIRQREEALMQSKQSQLDIEGNIQTTASTIRELRAQLGRLEADEREYSAQVRGSGAQIMEKDATTAADGEAILVAPEAGRVVSVSVTKGTAVQAGGAVAVLIPEGSSLEAHLWAPSRSIGFVRKNDQVRLMYDAYPYQRFGVGRGRVTSIANAPNNPDELPISVDTKEALYKITVKLDRQTVDAYGQSWKLTSGGRLSADLVLDSRSIFEWLFEPLFAVKRRG